MKENRKSSKSFTGSRYFMIICVMLVSITLITPSKAALLANNTCYQCLSSGSKYC